MTVPLTTLDVVTLRPILRPPWQRRMMRWLIFLSGLAVIATHTVATPIVACSDAAPCGPDPFAMVTVGLLLAATVVGAVHAGVAAGLASAFALLLAGYGYLARPVDGGPAWLYVVDVAFIGACLVVARLGRWRATPAYEAWLATNALERPTIAADGLPVRPGRPLRVLAVVCIAAGVLVAGWTAYAQTRVDAQQLAATRVTAEVVTIVDEYTVRVRLPGGELANIGVLASAEHPVGQLLRLYVDDHGLQQPVNEPYDASFWLLLAVVLAGLGIAGWARARDAARRFDDFRRTEQPVTAVYVRTGHGIAAVYPADARPGEPAIADIYCDVGLDHSPHDDDPTELPPTRPGRLIGVPVPGAWCTIELDGVLATPFQPLRQSVKAPPFTRPHEAAVDPISSVRVHTLPLREEEVAAIRPTDLDPNPHQTHVHRQSPLVAYGFVVGIPLVLFGPLVWVDAPYWVWLLIAGAGVLAVQAFVRNFFERGRLAWNGAGLAVIAANGESGRARWHEVTLVERAGDVVIVHLPESRLPVTALGIGGFYGGQRNAGQLSYALRHARDQAITHANRSDVDVPRVSPRSTTRWLMILIFVYVPLLAWALQTFAHYL